MYQQYSANIIPRATVITMVVAVHIATLLHFSEPAQSPAAPSNELAISFSMATQAPQTAIQKIRTVVVTPVALAEQTPTLLPTPSHEQAITTEPQSAAPVIAKPADTEPVYRASYLDNPPPSYPMVARRMGMQGRVLLNVEVLADGRCGQIHVEKSSGYAMLDSAALQTVKAWRFLPASQAGHAVDKWFMIPVQFSLKGNAA